MRHRRTAATATAVPATAATVSDSSTEAVGGSLDSSGVWVAADVSDSASIPVSNTVTIEFGENRVLIVTSNGATDPSALLMDVLRQCAEAEAAEAEVEEAEAAEAAEDADANSVTSVE
jgi:hypothetical protein